MDADPPDRFAVFDALTALYALPFGPVRTAASAALARAAETLDDETAYLALMQEAEAAVFGGSPRAAVAAFVRALARAALLGPDEYDVRWHLNHYKWVLEGSFGVAEVPREQFEQLLDDYSAQMTAAGGNGREPLLVRRTWAMHRRQPAEVRELHRQIERLRPDSFSECPPCDADRWAGWLAEQGEHDAALAAAGPILAGQLKCSEVPARTLPALLPAWRAVGQPDEAETAHRRGLRLIGANPYFLPQAGRHLLYLAAAGRTAAARRLVARFEPVADAADCSEGRFWFWHGTATALPDHPRAAGERLTAARVLDMRNGADGYAAVIDGVGGSVL